MIKVNQTVQRNPKIWRNCKARFKVLEINGKRASVQRIGTAKCPWTGKQMPYIPMTYLISELSNI